MPAATQTNGNHVDGANGVNGHGQNGTQSALCSVEAFTSEPLDYVVIGGGTAGLVVAARLTEDPSITVGVLEAGEARLEDQKVLTPTSYPTLIGRGDYDWLMTSVPQVRRKVKWSMLFFSDDGKARSNEQDLLYATWKASRWLKRNQLFDVRPRLPKGLRWVGIHG